MKKSIHRLASTLSAALMAIICLSVASCDRLHEDLDPCPSGARLRFVYDYNMEFANAFPSQVDCLTLLVYDAQGRYVRTVYAGRPQTADENWRMTIDLPAGTYRFVAWGGMGGPTCQASSFSFLSEPATTPMTDLRVQLDPSQLTSPAGTALHALFYGDLTLTIPPSGANTTYVEGTVYMMRDTNDIRVILANVSGLPTDEADFDFSIITDNTLLGWNNDLIPAGETTYLPFARGNEAVGVTPLGLESVMAYAEMSTSRFVYGNAATLLITRRSDGAEVVRLPLVNLLLLYKSSRPNIAGMDRQEYLDRENYWPITLLLDNKGTWIRTTIVVNDWVVRINNAKL